MHKQSAIKMMNKYGTTKTPFLFIVDFEMKALIVHRLDKINNFEIRYDINGTKNYITPTILLKNILFTKQFVSFNRYQSAFSKVKRHIANGNTYLLNLTFPTKVKINLSLEEIFYRSRAKYKLCFQNKFVVFSPETFIRIHNNKISSYPMKGTINASIPNAKQILLSDPKELAEHNTIVDLIRNDLSMVAKNVRVERFRYIDKIKTHNKNLLQVSSKIVGELGRDYRSNIGDIIFALLPAGSISGAPKKKTIQIIKETENYKRGYYTGVFGYFDGNNLDSGVMIRFIEKTGKQLKYKSGGGITSMSDSKSEYQELIDKVYVPIV
ncbi:MAG: aminodeoxychorismate synthase component I [Chlorobiaceae bacterium]|nr:aminodeoxychorismate synthase component I [Chlorobiaceae bacterium]